MNLNFKSEHNIPQTTQSTSFLTCIWSIQGLIDAACEAKFLPMWGNPNSLGLWIPQSGFRIPGTHFQFLSVELGFWIPIVSAIPDSLSCIPDSNSWISDYISKIFLDSGVHRHLTLGEKLLLENLRKVWCLYVFWFNFILG